MKLDMWKETGYVAGGLLVSLIVLLVLSCGTERSIGELDEIPVEYGKDILSGSSVLTGEHRVIPLSAPCGEAVIKWIERVMFAGDRIFVMDRGGNKVLAFDSLGHFVASTVGMTGRGHNEYIRVIDATVDEKNRVVYAFCDAPYCVMMLDFDLRLIKKVALDYYVSEVAQDGTYIYGLQTGGMEKAESRIIAIDKGNLGASPRTVVSTEKGVRGILTCFGKSLVSCGDTVYASLPMDNRIFKLAGGKVVSAFGVDFGNRTPTGTSDNLHYDVFLSRNGDSDWMIHNVACSDSLMLFNTNSRYVYVVDRKRGTCRTGSSFDNNYFPFSASLMIPAQGMPGCIVYEVRQTVMLDYVRRRKEKGREITPPSVMRAVRDCDGKGNPVLVVWKMR